ncbi:MAG TPA: hypothetical protein VJ828_16750 [Lacipirellulaceae bacterium]|nr:hypothetical protein [Lacipirellulaceae bacterium]
MANSPTETAMVPARLVPAWLFSIAVHCTMMVFLGLALQSAPRGAAEEPGRSAGIVLKRTSADGDLYEGEEKQPAQTATTTDIAAPELLPTLPSETLGANLVDELPQPPTPGAQASSGGGPPDAVQIPPGGSRQGAVAAAIGDARVSVFGVEGTGSKFVYVFDRSSSMDGPPLAAAKRQLIESLRSLESAHQFHIIFFNTRTRSFDIAEGGRRIAFATDRNKQLAANFVGGITADGGTDRLAALREAIGFAPDVIFFLTDADDAMSASELAEIARTNRRLRTAICVIEFGRRATPPGSNFLTELARESGGQYGYVNAAALSR